jgi:UDP-N-acetyl-D-glucosamine dehydrogenase
MLCCDMNIDVWEVIRAASSKPFGFMPFWPGPGVGGHCIPVDPMYLSWKVRQFGGSAKFIELARDVNDAMPMYVVTRVQDLLNERERSLKGSRLLVLGVAYKADISDMRESPAMPLISLFRAKGADVTYADPFVPTLEIDDVVLHSVDLAEDGIIEGADCVVIVTNHSSVDHDAIAQSAQLVFDTRRAIAETYEHVHRL